MRLGLDFFGGIGLDFGIGFGCSLGSYLLGFGFGREVDFVVVGFIVGVVKVLVVEVQNREVVASKRLQHSLLNCLASCCKPLHAPGSILHNKMYRGLYHHKSHMRKYLLEKH